MSIHLKKCLIQLTINDESRRINIEQTIFQLVKNTLANVNVDGLPKTTDTVLNLGKLQIDLPAFNEDELTTQFSHALQQALVKAIKQAYQDAKNNDSTLVNIDFKAENNEQLNRKAGDYYAQYSQNQDGYTISRSNLTSADQYLKAIKPDENNDQFYQPGSATDDLNGTAFQKISDIHSTHWEAITQRLLFNVTASHVDLTDIQGNSVFSTLLLNCLQAQPHYIKPFKSWLKSQLVRYRLIEKLSTEERVRLIAITAHPLLALATVLREAQSLLPTQATVYWSRLLYFASADTLDNVTNDYLCQRLLLDIKLDSLRLVTQSKHSASHRIGVSDQTTRQAASVGSKHQGDNVFNLANTSGQYTANRLFQSIKQRLHHLLSQPHSLSEQEWCVLKTGLLLRTEAAIDNAELNTLAALIKQLEQRRQSVQQTKPSPLSIVSLQPEPSEQCTNQEKVINQEKTRQQQRVVQQYRHSSINYQQDITLLDQIITQLRGLVATSDNPLLLNQQLEQLNQLLANQTVCNYTTVQQLHAWLAQIAEHYSQLTIDQIIEQLDHVIKRMMLLLSALATKKTVTTEQVNQYQQDNQLIINLAKHPLLPTHLVVTIHYWLHKMAALTKASGHLQKMVHHTAHKKNHKTTHAEHDSLADTTLPLLNTESALALACQVAERLQAFTRTLKITRLDFVKARHIIQTQQISWLTQVINALLALWSARDKKITQTQPLSSTLQTDKKTLTTDDRRLSAISTTTLSAISTTTFTAITQVISASLSILERTEPTTLSPEVITLANHWKQLTTNISLDSAKLMDELQHLQGVITPVLTDYLKEHDTILFPLPSNEDNTDNDTQALSSTYVVEQSIWQQLQQLMPSILDLLSGIPPKQQVKHDVRKIPQGHNLPCPDRSSLYYLLAQIHCQLSLWALHNPQQQQLSEITNCQQKLLQWQSRLEPTYGITTTSKAPLLSNSVWWQKGCDQILIIINALSAEHGEPITHDSLSVNQPASKQAINFSQGQKAKLSSGRHHDSEEHSDSRGNSYDREIKTSSSNKANQAAQQLANDVTQLKQPRSLDGQTQTQEQNQFNLSVSSEPTTSTNESNRVRPVVGKQQNTVNLSGDSQPAKASQHQTSLPDNQNTVDQLIELATQLVATQDVQQALNQLNTIPLPDYYHQPLKGLFEQAQQHQAEQFDTPQLNTLINQITTQQHQLKQIQRQQQELMLSHDAGLVLLWPFLSNLFSRAELINTAGDEFTDEACQLTARAMLCYMRGEVNYSAENTLVEDNDDPVNNEVVANLLVGLPPETIVTPAILLDEKTKQLADDCLMASIQHWQALKDMSITSFQQLFLQRQAAVAISEVGWRIEVKKHAVDILLSKLPWPLGVISLPWLEQGTALFIEWDSGLF